MARKRGKFARAKQALKHSNSNLFSTPYTMNLHVLVIIQRKCISSYDNQKSEK